MALEPVPPLNTLSVVMLPFYVATVVDGVVYDVMNVSGQQAAVYLSQPKFVQINHGDAGIGWTYDEETGTFTAPRSL
jgi:hypothetical protein